MKLFLAFCLLVAFAWSIRYMIRVFNDECLLRGGPVDDLCYIPAACGCRVGY